MSPTHDINRTAIITDKAATPLLNVVIGQALPIEFVAIHHRFLHSGRFTDVEKAVNRHIRWRGRGFPEAQQCGKAADCRYLEVPTPERARSVFHIVTPFWSHRHFVAVDNLHAKRSPGRSQTDRRLRSGNLRTDNLIVHKRNATPDFCTQHSAIDRPKKGPA